MTPSTNLLRRAGLVLLSLGAAASAFAFAFVLNEGTGLPFKWAPGNIPLKIMLGDAANLTDGSSFNTSARAAAQTWNGLIGSAQIQTSFGTGSATDNNGVSEMVFATTIFGRSFGSGVLAVTTGGSGSGNERREADVIFNNRDFVWDSYRGSRGGRTAIDLQRVAIHELGHLLGLDHPDEHNQSVNAIMNSRVSDVDTVTTDDTVGIQSIYGPPSVPPNDAFANATVISLNSSGTVTVTGYNTKATKENGEPSHAVNSGPSGADNPGGRSVWWRWTAPSAGNVTLDTRGSYFDTILGVYTGSALNSLTRIASNDDVTAGTVQASLVNFAVTAGTVYRIAVDGFNNIVQDATDTAGADSAGISLTLQFTSGGGGSVPVITSQPASVTVVSGSNVSFSVTATSAPAPTYQWLFNGAAITGATSSTFSIASATSAQAGTYAVTVTNPNGSVTSDNATLSVNAPIITTPTPTPSGGGGGGGGGAPSLWFYGLFAALGLGRFLRHPRPTSPSR